MPSHLPDGEASKPRIRSDGEPDGLTLMDDVSSALWVVESIGAETITPTETRLKALIPGGFESYARILHPARKDVASGRIEIPWVEVASITGNKLHPTSTFEEIAGIGPDDQSSWIHPPYSDPQPAMVSYLVTLLRPHTLMPAECEFGLWDGYGYLPFRPNAWFVLPYRGGHHLFRGRLESVTNFYFLKDGFPEWSPPQIWWPLDHAWCVASDVDLHSTYVAGSAKLVRSIMDDPALEAFEASLEDRIDRMDRRLEREG